MSSDHPVDPKAQARARAPHGEVEGSGRTVEEAVDRALAAIGMSRGDVEVEVLDEGSRGVLGLGAREARVRVRVRSRAEKGEITRSVAESLIALMGFEATIGVEEGPESVRVAANGEDLAALIGKRGQTLGALEVFVSIISGRRLGAPVRVEMDVMGYRERRRITLEALAQRAAERVARSGREVALSPMDARDRRTVHVALQEHPVVTTSSRGEGELRRVVVMPREVPPAAEGGKESPTARRPSTRDRRPPAAEPPTDRSRSGNVSPAVRGDHTRNPNYSGRWTSTGRPGRFQERPYHGRGAGKSQNRRPAGRGAAQPGRRPEGLPVDEELEAEIQAHLESRGVPERLESTDTPGAAPPDGSRPGRGDPGAE